MTFVEKLCDVFDYVLVIFDLYFHFVIYKFERNKIQRNEENISGKCVIVTGGNSGIGRSCAIEFARRGATVVIGDKNFESGQTTVDEIRKVTGNMNVVNDLRNCESTNILTVRKYNFSVDNFAIRSIRYGLRGTIR